MRVLGLATATAVAIRLQLAACHTEGIDPSTFRELAMSMAKTAGGGEEDAVLKRLASLSAEDIAALEQVAAHANPQDLDADRAKLLATLGDGARAGDAFDGRSLAEEISQQSRALADARNHVSRGRELHRSGDYLGADAAFRAAITTLQGLAAPGATSELQQAQLGAAAAALKRRDFSAAERACGVVLGEPAVAAAPEMRALAYYRRALAREGNAATAGDAGTGNTAKVLAKAYRDAFLAWRMRGGRPSDRNSHVVDGEEAVGSDGGKAHRLLTRLRSSSSLSEKAQLAAEKTAERLLADWERTLAMPLSASGGAGRLTPFGAGAGDASPLAAMLGGMGGMGGGTGGLASLLGGLGGAGGSGGGLGLESMLKAFAGGSSDGSGPAGAAESPLKKALEPRRLFRTGRKVLRNPGVAQMLQGFLRQASPEALESAVAMAGLPLKREQLEGVSTALANAGPDTLLRWLGMAEVAVAALQRLGQAAAVVRRLMPLLGLWMVWVWLRSCWRPLQGKSAAVVAKAAAAAAAAAAAGAGTVLSDALLTDVAGGGAAAAAAAATTAAGAA